MKKFFSLLALVCCFGCDPGYRYENSDILNESGEVADTAYVPAGHGTSTGWNFGKHGGLVISDVDISARYAIVFKCQHGKFVIEGNHAQQLYSKLCKGDKVNISYQTIFKIYYDKDQKEAGREAIKLDFLDANVTQKAEKE